MSKLAEYKKALKTAQEKRNNLTKHVFSHSNDGSCLTPEESDFKGFVDDIDRNIEYYYEDPVSEHVHVTVLYDNNTDLETDKKMWKAKIKAFDNNKKNRY